MEPDRFDDVGYELLEGAEPPRSPHRRRVVAATGLGLAVCALAAAAALAVTTPGSNPPPANPPAAPPSAQLNADGVPVYHHGAACRAGKGRDASRDKYPERGRHRPSSTPRY